MMENSIKEIHSKEFTPENEYDMDEFLSNALGDTPDDFEKAMVTITKFENNSTEIRILING